MANSVFLQDRKAPLIQGEKKNPQALPQPLTLFSSDITKPPSPLYHNPQGLCVALQVQNLNPILQHSESPGTRILENLT